MTTDHVWRSRVEAATVRLTKLGGQGVLVRGGFVLTATHCIEWSGSGGMVLGDFYLEPIVTKSGAAFSLTPCAADAVSDLAVLVAPDRAEFPQDCDRFEVWEENAEPLELSGAFEQWCQGAIAPREDGAPMQQWETFAVHCLTHTGRWVSGQAKRLQGGLQGPQTWVHLSEPIEGGTSGGPIVDNAGALVGVISHTSEVDPGTSDGEQPVAIYALPAWLLKRVGAR